MLWLCFQTIAQSFSMNSGAFGNIFGSDFDRISYEFIDFSNFVRKISSVITFLDYRLELIR